MVGCYNSWSIRASPSIRELDVIQLKFTKAQYSVFTSGTHSPDGTHSLHLKRCLEAT